ncbi:MAG: hypothetical protein ABL874_05245 [Sphingopyxis sp.]
MKSLFAMVAALSLAVTATANAQQFSDTSYGARDMRVGVGITVPLGGGEGQRQAPRAELSIARDHMSANGSRLSLRAGAPQPLRIGLSLEPQSRVMLNGRAVQGPADNQRGASTMGKVGIGVGVALLVVGGALFALYQYADAQSE